MSHVFDPPNARRRAAVVPPSGERGTSTEHSALWIVLAVLALVGASCATNPVDEGGRGAGDATGAPTGDGTGNGTPTPGGTTGQGNTSNEPDAPTRPEQDAVSVADDIQLEDTFVAITHKKKGGRIQVGFANKDHSKYLISYRGAGGGTTWRKLDPERLALLSDDSFSEKVFPNIVMKKMVDDLDACGFFKHAVALPGQALDDASDFAIAPGQEYGVLVEKGGRLWGLLHPKPGGDKEYVDVYLTCKHKLIEYAQQVPAHKFSTQSADRAFGVGVPAPRK